MALITTLGGAESNSFVTLEEADALVTELFTDPSTWENLSDAQKELRLTMGAQLLGFFPLRGRTVYRNQGLCFPRTCQQYNQRFQIPDEPKAAQVWLAADTVHRALEVAPEVEAGLPDLYGTPSKISIAGLLDVSFQSNSSASDTGSMIENLVKSLPFPVYMQMKRYISSVRGGTVGDVRSLSTTTV